MEGITKKMSRWGVVGLLLLTAVSSATAQEKLLRWKLARGENIQVNFVQNTTMNTSIMGSELNSSADMGMVLLWHVGQVANDGTMEIVQSIKQLTMKMENPGGAPIEYDSSKPVRPEDTVAQTLAASIQPLVGVEFVQTMSARGEILDVTLTQEARASLAKAPAGSQLTQIFSKEGLKSLLHQAATVLPEGPVSPGDTWTGQTQTKSPVGTLVMDMTYTYRGTEMVKNRPLERIDVDVVVKFGREPNAMGLEVEVKAQQNAGTMFFDATSGRFVQTELNQNMTLETAIGEKVHRQRLNTVLRMQFATTGRSPQRVGQLDSIQATPVSTRQ